MTQIGWDETTPADTESLSQGDDRIRSLKTSLRQGLSAEHTWPSAGGDAGVHLVGSARAYVGTQSQVSSSGTDGRLMWASDTSRFFHVGSAGTSLIGGSRVISVGTTTGFSYPQRHHWVEEFGIARVPTGSFGSVVVTIPNSGYSGVPFVQLTQNDTDDYATVPRGGVFQVFSATPTTFGILQQLAGGSGWSVAWRSLGTRVL